MWDEKLQGPEQSTGLGSESGQVPTRHHESEKQEGLPNRSGDPPGRRKIVQPLEDDLPHELDVAGFARPDGRSPVEVADGVTHRTEPARDEVRGAPVGGEIM